MSVRALGSVPRWLLGCRSCGLNPVPTLARVRPQGAKRVGPGPIELGSDRTAAIWNRETVNWATGNRATGSRDRIDEDDA